MIRIYLWDGAQLASGEWVALAQPADDEATDQVFDTLLYRSGSPPTLEDLGYRAVRVVATERGVLAIGRLGRTSYFPDKDRGEEFLVPGVEAHGFLNDARRIGSTVFSVGMRRQVYAWNRARGWRPIHKGVLDDRKPPARITGFLSIDGTNESELWCVGLGGEIWKRVDEEWRVVPSPTNLSLEQVRVVPSGEAYVAGQQGTLLRASGDSIEVIEHDATTGDFRGLEWFKDHLYLATPKEVLRLDIEGGSFELLPMDPPEGSRFSRIRAGPEALWLFGGQSVFRTTDGLEWREAVLA